MDLAKLMVKFLEKKFDISAYHDEYQQQLREAIIAKINGKEIVATDNVVREMIDPMEAMRQVIEMLQNGKVGTA
ncbi:hypothetical protein [Enterocloster clostridioformis]|uniref:hypothetical protein n=1 Tax=Enterocloster clostridioformis TaxID=1531 RepID=UPI00023276C8|nr:hypothetical protein [Enterocloster clostridioformis]EHG33180.1 hypothetical protein HMPREF9467_00791 [ [[Clostridium] clostridioforme 2_1_49FAA]